MSQDDDRDLKRKKLRTAFLLLILMAVIYFVTVMIKQ
jgi:hypothetical protein